ncbi:MAG: ribonuclease J [Deinococcales bacterium]
MSSYDVTENKATSGLGPVTRSTQPSQPSQAQTFRLGKKSIQFKGSNKPSDKPTKPSEKPSEKPPTSEKPSEKPSDKAPKNTPSSKRSSSRSKSSKASTPNPSNTSNSSKLSSGGDKKYLHIIPLGGMGEVGKNMFAFEYEGEILLIDGGLAFPDADMLGVDILIPKIDWVVENADKVVGWILTHGHEDHIGGLPYMLKQLPRIPMYGAKLTLGLLRGKFEEFHLNESDVDLREISPDDRIKVSKYFTVDFFRMTHSIPDNSGLIIHTPIGRVVHTGDFKLDYNPADGKTSHLHKLADAGVEGVLALISDSTRAESAGHSPSEQDVMNAIESIVVNAKGRVVITTFSSHIHRIQNIIRIAERHNRRVVIEGRSMVKNIRIASDLGYLEMQQPIINIDEMTDLADNKILFLTTGSQGQPMAALSRLAAGSHAKISLREGDTVILSSHPIPGNEEAVNRVINQLYARKLNVFYPPNYRVHTSGHAYQNELKMILDLTRPKFFIPWHGEVRHQMNHVKVAEGMTHPPEKSLIAENGDILRLSRDSFDKAGQVDVGVIYLDNVTEVSEPLIRDRQTLSNEGMLVIMAVRHRKNPIVEVISRGVVSNHHEFSKELEKIVMEQLVKGVREKKPINDTRDDIFYSARRYVRKHTGQNPLIIPTVIEG